MIGRRFNVIIERDADEDYYVAHPFRAAARMPHAVEVPRGHADEACPGSDRIFAWKFKDSEPSAGEFIGVQRV